MQYIFYDYKEDNRLLEFLFTEYEEARLENLVVDLKNIFPTYNLYLVDYTKPSLGILIFVNELYHRGIIILNH